MNAWPAPPRPAQVKKITRSTRWTRAPARELTPTAATPAVGSTPAFCRNRAFSAIPPTLAGETRLTYEDAFWVSRVGQNGTRTETPPSSAMALATYVSAEKPMATRTHAHWADSSTGKGLPTLASWGSRK